MWIGNIIFIELEFSEFLLLSIKHLGESLKSTGALCKMYRAGPFSPSRDLMDH